MKTPTPQPNRPFKRLWCDERIILQLPNCTLKVYLAQLLHEDRHGESFPSRPLIQSETNLSERAIEYARAWLRKHGWLIQTGWHGRGLPKYRTAIGTIPKTQEKRGGKRVKGVKRATANFAGSSNGTTANIAPEVPQTLPPSTANIAGSPTANFAVQKENHISRTIKENQEGEGSPGAKDVRFKPTPTPVKDQPPDNRTEPPRRKDTNPNKAKDALDEAMALYRKKTPAYAGLEHCICPEDALQMLDDKVLNPAFQVALEICTILGESITHDNPRPEWQAFYVRVRTACGPTATMQQVGEIVKRLTNTGVKIDPYMSAGEFAKLANTQVSTAAASTTGATA